MSISFTCFCGKTYVLRDELAGKRARCVKCKAIFEVPANDVASDFEVVQDDASEEASYRDTTSPERPGREPPSEAPPPPRPRPKRRRRRSRDERSGGGFGIHIGASVITGVLAMIGAVVWFVLGLYFGWIFFYPPILFIIGLVAFIRGLLGQSDDD